MKQTGCKKLSADEFVGRFLNEDAEAGLMVNMSSTSNCVGMNGNNEQNRKRRRSNLTEFNASQTAKRKNESAKRVLTSVVNQVRATIV